MTTNTEIRFEPYIQKRAIPCPVVVHREFDLMRQEESIAVSCTVGNRRYGRRISFYADEFDYIEQCNLADQLRRFILTDIQDTEK